MSLKDVAFVLAWPNYLKAIPINPDGSANLPYPGKTETACFSKMPTFDFTGAASSPELTIKINDGAEETKTVDLSGVADDSAITGAELASAITTSSFTGVTVAVDSRGYVKISVSAGTPETDYLQVYNECAEYAGFGGGHGVKFLHFDTQESFAVANNLVEKQEIEKKTVNDDSFSVYKDGYVKGRDATLVDAATDYAAKALFEGGTWVSPHYTPPKSDSVKTPVSIETRTYLYLKGESPEEGYHKVTIDRLLYCTPAPGNGSTGDRNLQSQNFTFTAIEYNIPDTTLRLPTSYETVLTRSEYAALNWTSI